MLKGVSSARDGRAVVVVVVVTVHRRHLLLTARGSAPRGRRPVSVLRLVSETLLSAGHSLAACIAHHTFMLALLTRRARAVHLRSSPSTLSVVLLARARPSQGIQEDSPRRCATSILQFCITPNGRRAIATGLQSMDARSVCQKAHQAALGNGVWRSPLHGTSAERAVGAGSWVCSPLASGHARERRGDFISSILESLHPCLHHRAVFRCCISATRYIRQAVSDHLQDPLYLRPMQDSRRQYLGSWFMLNGSDCQGLPHCVLPVELSCTRINR